MVLEIRKYGDPVLKRESQNVEKIDDNIKKLLDDMVDTMREASGVGLAAPQVGINLNVVVIEIEGKVRKLINPVIIEKSAEEENVEEGCLSVPGIWEKVKRAARVKVKYTNENGEEVIEEGDGLLARAFQHEIDHLRGVVFVEKISSLAKNLLAKKLLKMKKETLKVIKEEEGIKL